jgi:hypothetical protein
MKKIILISHSSLLSLAMMQSAAAKILKLENLNSHEVEGIMKNNHFLKENDSLEIETLKEKLIRLPFDQRLRIHFTKITS